VISIPVRGPEDTKRVIEAIIACLGGDQQADFKAGLNDGV
jgi:hypothetical protein